MIVARGVALGALGLSVSTQLLHSQNVPHYRAFRLGSEKALSAAFAGVPHREHGRVSGISGPPKNG